MHTTGTPPVPRLDLHVREDQHLTQHDIQSYTGTCNPGPCYQKCGQTHIKLGSGFCHCDYYCDQTGDCCGSAASKNALCPSMEPSRNKSYITDCDGEVNRRSSEPAARRTAAGSSYLPGAARMADAFVHASEFGCE